MKNLLPSNFVPKLLLIFMMAFFLRLVVIGAWWHAGNAHHLSGDSEQYYEIAKNLAQGTGYQFDGKPTARRVPVYPILIAGLMKLGVYPWGLQILQAMMGALSCVLICLIGAHFFGNRVGILSGILLSLDYLLVKQIVYILPEILFVFLTLITGYFFIKARATSSLIWSICGGFSAALTSLTKEALALYFLLLPVLFLKRENFRKSVLCALAFISVFVLTLAPWVLRNRQVYGEWISLSINSGHAFYQGNNPDIRIRMHGGDWIEGVDTDYPLNDPELPPLTTLEADRYLMKKSIEFIRQNPLQFVQLTLHKAVRLWYPYFTKGRVWSKALMTLSYFAVIPFSILGILWSRSRWREFSFIYLLIIYGTLIYSVTIPSIRYRYPLMPFLMMFAAFAIVEIWQYFAHRRKTDSGVLKGVKA